MRYLTADFGSTYTKLTAIDGNSRKIVGTAAAFTTIETHIGDGFRDALLALEQNIGEPWVYDELVCCSSAAGGLKMVALGLVPELTSKAARMAASSAGAKVVKTYAYEISKAEQHEIATIAPDLILLCGGTDGGNKEVILANARRLMEIPGDFSIIVAGNKTASYELEEILSAGNKSFVITENVMPEFNRLNIEPAKRCIMELFISKIIEAKGLTSIQEMSRFKIVPTPYAVLNACNLLSLGTKQTPGIGDLMAIDLGGATTDVYSIAKGEPTMESIMLKGIPEPYSKRSVEGDLGMRYSLTPLLEQADSYKLSLEAEVAETELVHWVKSCTDTPDTLASNEREVRMEEALARAAVRIAMERHCGTLAKVYTPMGELFTLNGKDLTQVPFVLGIGGAILNSPNPKEVLKGALYDPMRYESAKPKKPAFLLDKRYIMASMGLLSSADPELALELMKKEVVTL